MLKSAYSSTLNKRLAQLTRPYYPYDDPNSRQHIQEVRRRAQKMTRRLYGRSLNPDELAAVLFHDNTKREFGSENHGRMGADRAAAVLAAAALLPQSQINSAAEAIRVHDDNLDKFPSRTAELLASADANPPDIDWFLNKAYCWNKRKGRTIDEAADNIINNGIAKSYYGVGGEFNYPGIYRKYYGDRVPKYQQTLTDMDQDFVKQRLAAYHKKYGIDPDNPTVIHNV